MQGMIVSHKMQKTAVVRVDALKLHSRYKKYYRSSKKFKAHDEGEEYQAGDLVLIRETRPLSKEKRWKIVGLIKRAETEMIGEEIKNENGKGL